jgi:crotonobetainyl-CoA:carnitine CoA-transferase CaiB-like acyl-CoA transferase
MAGLHEARRSGQGQMVDVSMADGALSWLAMVAGRYFCDGEVPKRGEQALAGGLVCYLPYEAADGWISCGALEPKFWTAFCNGIERPDLLEVQFEAPGSTGWKHVAEVFRSRTRAEWKAFNDEHDCCVEPVLDIDEALDSELVAARQMVVEMDQPGIGPVRQLGAPVKFSRTPADPTRGAPAFGEHTAEVLAEAGYSSEEIAAMIESGAAAGNDAAAEHPEFMK